MAEKVVVEYGGHSKEQVAYLLMERVAHVEHKTLHGPNPSTADRKWVLQTYAECLLTVMDPVSKLL